MLEDCRETASELRVSGNMALFDDTDESRDGDNLRNRLLSSFKAARGILLTLLSAIFIGFSAEFMALASKAGIPSFQLLFFMRLTELLALLPLLAFSRPRLTGENIHQNKVILLMAIVSNVYNVLNFLAFVYTVPGIAFGILQGSMPFFVACIGFIFLKESLVLVNCCGIVINVIGVILVAVGIGQKGAMSTQLLILSIVIPLIAALSGAPNMVIIRYVTCVQGVSIITAFLYKNVLGILAFLAITYGAETPVWAMSSRTGLYVVGLGLSKSLESLTIFHALKVQKAYITTAVLMFVIPFTMLLDHFFMQKVPNALQLGGVSLVVLGTVLVSIYTWWTYRQKELQRIFLEKLHFDPDEK